MRRIHKDAPRRKNLLLGSLLLAVLAIIVTASITNYRNQRSEINAQGVRAKSYQTELKLLNTQLDNAKKQQTNDQKDKAASQQQIQQLEQDKQDLQQQLQAKAEKSKLQQIAQSITVSVPARADSIVAGCGDNTYANYIYSRESGCNLTITNSEGCIGIGQACPASKLFAACPSLDYACENEFFTNYAVSRYGSWEGAYNAWLQNHWW